MTRLLTLIIFLWTQLAVGQPDARDLLTKESALEDLTILETSLLEIHPSIYRYTSKNEFKRDFENARNAIKQSLRIIEFSNLVAPIIAKVHCGHTFTIVSYVDENKGLLPLEVKLINDRLFVLKNYSSRKELLPGSEILEINGIPTANLLRNFRSKAVSDGYGLTFKDRTIEKYFRENFATYINQPDSFQISFEDYETKNFKIATIEALTNESIRRKVEDLHPAEEKPLDFYITKEKNVAVLKLRSFMAKGIKKQSGQNLKKVIKKSFEEMEKNKVNNLVIDIRWNTGGKASAAPLLFSYLTNKDFKFKRKLIFRHGYRFSYPEYLNRNKFNDWVNKNLDKKINDSTYEWTHHRNTKKTYKAKNNPYDGNLYIIINGMTASSGAEFAALAHVNGKGIFVGEESGGDYNGVNGYDRTYLQLPHSKIGLTIAGWRSIMAWDETKYIGHGVPPTYEVYPEIKDLLTGQDTELKFIYALIKK